MTTNPLSRNNLTGYLFTLPWIVKLIAVILFPMCMSFYMSFTKYDLLSPPIWTGASNYVRMFSQDKNFWLAVRYTLRYVVISVPARLITSLLVATFLSGNRRGIGTYRTLLYIPSIIGGSVAVAITWRYLFGTNSVINDLLLKLGIIHKSIAWLSNPHYAIYTLILLGMWQFGSSMLIFLAGIKNIPHSYHEAAIVDGGNAVQRYFHITLPMLSPVLLFNLVMQTIDSFMVFTQSLLVTNGGPLRTTTFYNLYLYTKAFNDFDMGYASAMAWVLLVAIAVVTGFIFKSSGRWVYYESEEG